MKILNPTLTRQVGKRISKVGVNFRQVKTGSVTIGGWIRVRYRTWVLYGSGVNRPWWHRYLYGWNL